MASLTCFCSVLILLLVPAVSANTPHSETILATKSKNNHTITFKLSGEKRVRIKEYADPNDHMPIMVWATNGSLLLKAVFDYTGTGMKDCDVVLRKMDIGSFEQQFENELVGSTPRSTSDHPQLLDFAKLYGSCAEVHDEIMRKPIVNPKPKVHNTRSRKKRDLSKWIWPGTKWCGYGNIAETTTDYGLHFEIDKCCQEHDRCPLFIQAFNTKYYYSNYQIHTITHCDCDEKFFQCLDNVSRTCDAAKYLGDFYFNFIQLNCFTFEYGEVCKEYTWWGGCNKKGFDKFAKVRHTPKFMA